MNWFKQRLWPAWFWNRYYAALDEAYDRGYGDGMGQPGNLHIISLVRKQTVEAEQARIIGLLETLRCPDNGVEHDCLDELGGYTINDVIALVKGKAD